MQELPAHDIRPFSLFGKGIRNTTRSRDCTLAEAVKILQSDRSKELIEPIRSATDKSIRNVLKSNLDYWTFSGTFKKREVSGLKIHSGLIVIDFDEVPDLASTRQALISDPYTLLLFTSPTGSGLKCLVKIDPGKHLDSFLWLEKYYLTAYSLQADQSGKDVSRACFISYDPNPHLNLFSSVVPATLDPIDTTGDTRALKKKKTDPAPPKAAAAPEPAIEPGTMTEEQRKQYDRACFVCDQIERHQIDITPAYDDWVHIGFALATLGESARELYHRASQYHPEYNRLEADKKFDDALKNGRFKNAAKFFSIAKDYGLEVRLPRRIVEKEETGPAPTKKRKDYKFWYEIENTKTGLKELNIHSLALIEFLNENGFWLYPLKDDESEYQFVRIGEGIVEQVNSLRMKKFTNQWLLDQSTIKGKDDDEIDYRRVLEKLVRGGNQYFDANRLENLPFKRGMKFVKDDPNTCWLFYENCAVKITATAVTTHKYEELDGLIWLSQKIRRKFRLAEKDEQKDKVDGCDFARYVRLAATGKKDDALQAIPVDDPVFKKILAFASAIGYLVHAYKDPSNAKAVVAVDATISRGKEANGRSGKSILAKGVGHVISACTFDARNFNFNQERAFEKVNLDTRLLNFNDASPKFELDRLFGIITEGIYVKKMYKEGYWMPFQDAPKLYISTNFTLKGDGGSYEARQFLLEFSSYFNKEYSPADEFKHRLFDDWDEKEWNRFDNYIVECVQTYLAEGLIPFPTENYEFRKLIDRVPEDFIDFCENDDFENVKTGDKTSGLQPGIRYDKKAMFERFKSINTDFAMMKMNTFSGWLKTWAEYKGYEINAHCKTSNFRDKSGDKEFVTFTNKKKDANE